MHREPVSPRFGVHPSSGVPVYRQIMDAVRADIANGRCPVGSLLPSVRDVAKELEINPMTVSKAYSLLESEGVVERLAGQGMRVLPPAPRGSLAKRRSQLRRELQQLMTRAYALGLRGSDVREELERILLEEKNDHD
jgi:GntR family transcriptional regulator